MKESVECEEVRIWPRERVKSHLSVTQPQTLLDDLWDCHGPQWVPNGKSGPRS